jgi:hypothetical protein
MDTRTPLPAPAYPTPPPFAPDSRDARTSRRDVGYTSAAVVAIVSIVATCIAMAAGREPLGPSEWDARIVPLVSFVEEERGHTFAHPVYVEFLTAEQYRSESTDGAPTSADEREYYDVQARTFRALGLIGGAVDLAAEQDEIRDSGTLAYYSPDDRTIYVRGLEVTPSLRVTLVHELTHALQHQAFNFDLSHAQSGGEAFALRALAEGDAIRVEDAYYDTLSAEEQQQVADQSEVDVSSSKALNSDSAPVLLALFRAPYDLGVPFVRLLASIDDELDYAFDYPPLSEENIFDPTTFLTDDFPEYVIPVKPPAGAKNVAGMGNEVGVVMWYVLIATHLDQRQALTAVEGWAGDALTVYEQDDQLCAAMVFRGDTQKDSDEMYTALSRVGTSLLLDHKPKVSIDAGDVLLTLCDPGPSAKAPTVDAMSIFTRPTMRSLLLGLALEDPSVAIEQADCAVDKTVDLLNDARMKQLVEAKSREDAVVREVLASLKTAIAGCR